MMPTEDMDQLLATLEGFYPDKFTGMTHAQFDLWRTEFGDLPLSCALAAVRRWAMQHHHHYAPTLVSLRHVAEEIQQDERRERARHRTMRQGEDSDLPGLLQRTTDAYIAQAMDDDTATYGRLMGALAQRSLAQKMSREALAAQCQAWMTTYPHLAMHLSRAAAHFLSGWEHGDVPMMSGTYARG